MPLRSSFLGLSLALVLSVCSGCAVGTSATLEPIQPVTGAVRSTLVVPLVVANADGRVTFKVRGPMIAGLDRTSVLATTRSGGEYRWTPLAAHVGQHEFVFELYEDGDKLDEETAIVTVTPAADAAPVFLRPGAGATFDLERDPRVAFDVEVRDDDSLEVEIRPVGEMPTGAIFEESGQKRAHFEWTPSPDQAAAQERWTISIEADDGDHPPTRLDFNVVLRTQPREDCPGEPPVVTVVTPANDARVGGDTGIVVEVEATDDLGLKDAPLLYYTTTMPESLDKPDVTTFEQIELTRDTGDRWVGRIPPIVVAEGAEQVLYLLSTATDNDDMEGAICDHRTDSALSTVYAIHAGGGGSAELCDTCSTSGECASGICITSPQGGRCLAGCDEEAPCETGTCDDRTTVEGSVARACGTVATVCDGTSEECTDDSFEPNDTTGAAALLSSGGGAQICADNDDFYRLEVAAGTQIALSIMFSTERDTDLDMSLMNSAGMIVDTSAGFGETEEVEFCAAESTTLYARVRGFMQSEAPYSIELTESSSDCCTDDFSENDDTRTTARAAGSSFSGQVCPRDDDFLSIPVTSPSEIRASLSFTHSVGDLDLELYGPDGARVARSIGTTDMESFTYAATTTGTYALRVLGHAGARGAYTGTVTVTASASCTSSAGCGDGEVCDDSGACVDRACFSDFDCPSGHGCPTAGPDDAFGECGEECTFNADCRPSEACKRFPEGRYCARRGTAANGATCTSFADCGGQRACMPYAGGYCARAACTTNTDCETGTYCVEVEGTKVCALDCWDADSVCRLSEGYECDVRSDVSGTTQLVCVP